LRVEIEYPTLMRVSPPMTAKSLPQTPMTVLADETRPTKKRSEGRRCRKKAVSTDAVGDGEREGEE